MRPIKVRPGQIDAIVTGNHTIIGTSHRQPAVKNVVGSIRAEVGELFALPATGTRLFVRWGPQPFGTLPRSDSSPRSRGTWRSAVFRRKICAASAKAPGWLQAYGDIGRTGMPQPAGHAWHCDRDCVGPLTKPPRKCHGAGNQPADPGGIAGGY